MLKTWRGELWRLIAVVFIGLLAGLITGSLTLGLLLATIAYLAWHLVNLYHLHQWLERGKPAFPPDARGVWRVVFEHIYKLQQRNKKRKRNLRRLLKRFHKITVALPDAAVELRPSSEEIEWWNSAAARYLGFIYPRDTGQRVSNLLRHPAFHAYLKSGDYEQEIEIPSPVDENITLRIRVVPYSGNRRLLIARDMTRIQMLERTREDFVANVSHELRTPLTVISGYLETLLYAPECCAEFEPQLRSMQVQTERMNRIVEDLMLLSKLESERPEVDSDPVQVARMVESIVSQARELSGEERHDIQTELDESLCIRGREAELYSAFSNLVFNAVRYTAAGGLITVRWADTESGPQFAVEDAGMGIEPHHIQRITERFYRVDAGRSRSRGGTGLGLAIVKHVLLRHDTVLEVASEPGVGSTFSCRFSPERRIPCES